MDKNFSSMLFSNLENNLDQKDLSRTILNRNSEQTFYETTEEITKINFVYPINISYDSKFQEINSFTQKYNHDQLSIRTSSILPCNLDQFSIKKNKPIFSLQSSKPFFEHYYNVHCKKHSGSFYPELFCNGHRGKCIFVERDELLMTPIEFQNYSGSTNSDWKDVIKIYDYELNQNLKLRKNRMNRTSKMCSIKNLVKHKIFNLHSPFCNCDHGNELKNKQPSNINLISSFFLNSGKNLVILRSNTIEKCQLEIDLYDLNIKLNPTQIDFFKNFTKNDKYSTILQDNLQINQIDSKIYDEESYFNGNNSLDNILEAYFSINYQNKKLKSYFLQLNDSELNLKEINNVLFDSQQIESISNSNLIRGETVLLTNLGNVYLTNEISKSENDLFCVTKSLEPKFSSKFMYKNIKIGSQPRQFVYSDHSQILMIDSRIRTSINLTTKDLFSTKNNFLNPNELICRTDIIENNFNYHLACCSKTLILFDERFPNRPLLSWKHFLKSEPQFLNNTFLKPDRNIIILSDSNEIYAHQFSTKIDNVPVSFEFDRKLETPIDIINNLPESYDKRIHRYLENRLKIPILTLNHLRINDSFLLFQLLENQDLYYQTFKLIDSSKKLKNDSENNLLETWTNILKNVALNDSNILKLNFDQSTDTSLEESEKHANELKQELVYKKLLEKKKTFCSYCTINSINFSNTQTNNCLKCKKKDLKKEKLSFEFEFETEFETESEYKANLSQLNIEFDKLSLNIFSKKLLQVWNN